MANMKRTIVIGDIHGCFEAFQELLQLVDLKPEDEVVSVGDIVDRGPGSQALYAFFRDRPNAKVLMGNHERKHARGVLSYSQEIVKVQMGDAYDEFVEWCKALPYYHETPEAIIVHAFFENGKALAEQKEEVLSGTTSGTKYLTKLYGEDSYWQDHYRGKKAIIYGHHVVGDQPEIKNNTYGIDTGACHAGYLTAIELPSFLIHQVKVKVDHWASEMKKWQLPVLKAKDWSVRKFVRIEEEVMKMRYQKDLAVQQQLDKILDWVAALQALQGEIHDIILQKTHTLLAEHGKEGFKAIANQYPYKAFLFTARANQLSIDGLAKVLNTPEKTLQLAAQLEITTSLTRSPQS
ncbi:MAG: metallophosphoesterase [Saprospiraceae bacterium]|nr:metallophosphoesterase [Saprospiraceae bacterium]